MDRSELCLVECGRGRAQGRRTRLEGQSLVAAEDEGDGATSGSGGRGGGGGIGAWERGVSTEH